LAKITLRKSQDSKYDSPFAAGARKNRLEFKGGKEDDITIIIA